MSADQLELISALENEDAYPHQVLRIAIEETHISWVFLTGPFAYKIKKELKFGEILDFSTLSLRKRFCQKEVKINRILCGEMYKGVVKIVTQKESVKIADLKNRGKAVEYAVKMVEFPQECRMDNLLLNGKVDSEIIKKLALVLAKFHRSTPTNKRIRGFGRPEYVKRKIGENFTTLSKLVEVDPKFENTLNSFIKNNSSLFFQRMREDKVRDIHGDLYLKNVFLVHDKLYLYDRIEFNDLLRYADVAEDVAHFAMDLDLCKRTDLRKHFISEYIAKSKDANLEDIIYFLMCYKACVRVKVSFFRAESVVNDAKKGHIEEARSHLDLAESYLELF
jgi:aminoglycoside phosphotransferase family enzyme